MTKCIQWMFWECRDVFDKFLDNGACLTVGDLAISDKVWLTQQGTLTRTSFHKGFESEKVKKKDF